MAKRCSLDTSTINGYRIKHTKAFGGIEGPNKSGIWLDGPERDCIWDMVWTTRHSGNSRSWRIHKRPHVYRHIVWISFIMAHGDVRLHYSLRIDLSGHRLSIPIILSYEVDVMIGLCAVLVPSVIAATAHNLVLKPWLRAQRLAYVDFNKCVRGVADH
jgi:hypothetical protein